MATFRYFERHPVPPNIDDMSDSEFLSLPITVKVSSILDRESMQDYDVVIDERGTYCVIYKEDRMMSLNDDQEYLLAFLDGIFQERDFFSKGELDGN